MSGYNATSATYLSVATGSQTLITQSALSYVPGERISLVYASNSSIFMQGSVLAYNAVNGAMTVLIDFVSGAFGLQVVFNTDVWGETSGLFSPWNLALIGGIQVTAAPAVATIIVRTLDGNWDPQRGQGLKNYLTDIDAVAQIIATRLKFLEGEWFENLTSGTPLFQSLLGQSTTMQAVQLILRQRILGTPYVTDIVSFAVSYIPASRSFNFTAAVQTQFGPVTVSNVPN